MISKNSIDPPMSQNPLVTPDNIILDDEKIKPMILAFNEKIKLNNLVISKPADQSGAGAIKSTANDTSIAPVNGSDIDRNGVISSSASQPAEAEKELWPKMTELDDCPPSPTSQNIAIKQVISESIYLFPKQTELDDRPPSPLVDESKPNTQMISKPSYQSPKQTQAKQEYGSVPDLHLKSGMKPNAKVIREGAYLQAMPDEFSLSSSSPLSSHNHHMSKTDPAYSSPTTHALQATIRESYRTSAQPRLSSVVEESESFSRREFGELSYMGTFSSANHAVNHSDFGYKPVSYRHNNYHNFSYNLSSSYIEPGSGGFMNSKSAPAGTATRTGSTFGIFRRGTSDASGLRMGRRPIYRARKSRKPRTLASTILWPLVKIKNGYVGCMMGLEGTGDLSGMAQGGTYATAARYFADVPLSKSDSRSYG